MKKVKIFKNHEEYCANPSGSQYMTVTWASENLEKFINRSDIEVLSIYYAGGSDDATMVIYKEIE
jgi:hypothetical protein